jgi:hypothetical protein
MPQRLEWPKTNFEQAFVSMDEIISGGPPKDGIPSVDAPKFISNADAEALLYPDEPVVALSINGDHRAYALLAFAWLIFRPNSENYGN